MADVLLIIAEKGFQDGELADSENAIEKAGMTALIASKTAGLKKGALGGTAKAEISLRDINISDYKAIVFIGGPGSQQYFNDNDTLMIAKKAYYSNKIVAAICISPLILANAGILKGKKATVWDDSARTYSKMLQAKGALYTGKDVEQDGSIITANGPGAAKKFGEAIAKALNH